MDTTTGGTTTTTCTPATELGLTKFKDPLRIPPKITIPNGRSVHALRIDMREESVRLHSELPPTRVWTYNGSFPGPTIDVHRGQRLDVEWTNSIIGSFPVTAVELPLDQVTGGPGRDGGQPRMDVAALPPWTVVHLHGAHTDGGNDGWTENAVLPGGVQLARYVNEQRSSMLWYHDHAMAITALNVTAGLVGMYLLRDAEEDALNLPHGRREIPLVLCDRNLDLDGNGDYTGDLLYKTKITSDGIKIPFTGPFNVVNGVIWPHLCVEARWHRFRVVNASSLRPYGLVLRDEQGAPIPGALVQIGTDGGLLPAPVAVDGITLAPAERADILIDFGKLRGRTVVLGNTLPPPIPGAASPNPDIMQFRVSEERVADTFALPHTLSTSFVRLTHDVLPHDHGHRWVVLTLLKGNHPEMWEMVEVPKDEIPAAFPVAGIVQVTLADGKTRTLKRVSRTFRDAMNYHIPYNGWEVWNFLNLSEVNHPMHLHLVEFQTIGAGRERFDRSTFDNKVGGTRSPVTYLGPGTLDPGEQGWKDTIRVGDPVAGELVKIAARFTGGTGQYMYHCHIFEHEDEGMMRPFVVAPKEVMAVDPMGHGGGHGHGS